MAQNDPSNARASLETPLGTRDYYKLDTLGDVSHLPYSIRVLLEAVIRHCDGYVVTEDHARAVASYKAKNVGETEIPFKPGRVVLQDFTGVPAVVDLAAMRSAVVRMRVVSVPLVGSVTPNACNLSSPAAIAGNHCCFCASLP